jgi:hypothetical protein
MIPKLSSALPTVSPSSSGSVGTPGLRFVPDSLMQAWGAAAPLTELALPRELVEVLRQPLNRLGYLIDNGQLTQTLGKDAMDFHFNIVKNGSQRVLIQFQNEVLAAFTRQSKLALIEVREVLLEDADFRREKRLYIFYDSNPHCSFKLWIQQEWQVNYGVQSKFIPLTELKNLTDMHPEEQSSYLKLNLDLDHSPTAKPIPRDMTIVCMQRLAEILANFQEFQDGGARGRRVLIEGAGLAQIAASFDFDGVARTVAWDLILRLLDGRLDLLLNAMRSRDDLNKNDKDFVSSILEEYSFQPGGAESERRRAGESQ